MSPSPPGFSRQPAIAVIGLGYVGLPLAVALAPHFAVTGFDINAGRIAELKAGHDRTAEVDGPVLKASRLVVTDDPAAIAAATLFIVTVPTPVDKDNAPDLAPVASACRIVAPLLKKGDVVVFESTVYPGVTEDLCGPWLQEGSGLRPGVDFFLGYSPERINPGDRTHSVDRITKVVAGQTPAVTDLLADVYGKMTTGGVFRARDIKTAEAAKVIENAQRDINIAFVNEVTMIFQKLGLSVYDVLAAAGTKWNFLPFTPGLVGGHCIGVDPYYLAHRAQELGHDPQVILAGRRINDGMSRFIANQISAGLKPQSRILVLGLTFKEDVPDLRNSKVADLVHALIDHGHQVAVHDPLADAGAALHEYAIDLLPALSGGPYDAVIGAVSHRPYREMDAAAIAALVTPTGMVADIKGMWRDRQLAASIRRWTL